MKGILSNLEPDIGSAKLTIKVEGREAYDAWDELHGGEVEITIKKWHPKRSLSANAYMWQLIGTIAYVMMLPKEEVYRDLVRDAGIYTTMTVSTKAVEAMRRMWESHGLGWQVETIAEYETGFTDINLYAGSSAYNSAEMSRLIEAVIQDCESLGINCDGDQLRSLLEDEQHSDKTA